MAKRRVVAQAALAQFGATGIARQLLPFLLAFGLIWYLSRHLASIDPDLVASELSTITPLQWLLAVLATGLSFWAVGRYDAVLHRQFGSTVAPSQARRAGIVAIALSQTVGMGLFTGALIRWRMLPGLSLWQCTQLSIAVALSFLAGWAVVAAVAVLIFPVNVPWLAPLAVPVLCLAVLVLAASLLVPAQLVRLSLPPFRSLIRILALAAVDTGAAALAFAVLVPEASHLSPALLVPAFLVALGVGLATGTPGGVGPFETMLLTLLPVAEPESLLAGILAFRLVYYALPALLAAGVAIIGPRAAAPVVPAPLICPGHPPLHLLAKANAEAQLVHQGPFRLWSDRSGQSGWLVAETALSLVTLGDPVGAAPLISYDAPRHLAQTRDRGLAHYKCSARTAVHLRRSGYRLVRTGAEAWIDPARFTLDTPNRASLRRHLRKAERAGIRCEPHKGPGLPMEDLAAISAAWVARHGAERGFSMGRFHPDHLQGQKLFLARQHGVIVGFASFHATAHHWSLDLMRGSDLAPAGTMQALLVAAIRAAADEGALLSLAAVPAEHSGWLSRLIDRATGAAGLRQFKSAFAPDWRPLYLAAPGRLALVVAALDIANAIARPGPLKQHPARPRTETGFLSAWTTG
jgi:phosphatidylglycerol lysyltransferase